jgi:hypothetical protein
MLKQIRREQEGDEGRDRCPRPVGQGVGGQAAAGTQGEATPDEPGTGGAQRG